MDPIISFLCSPLGIVLAIIAAALAGRFLWHVVIFALEFALVAAIVGVVIYAAGGFGDIVERPGPAQHQAPVTYHAARRI
jgi:hypothetical protein